MLRILGRRVAVAIPTLFAIATAVFFLIYMIPGDPVVSILGNDATPAQYAHLRGQLGLDRPVLVQYGDWLLSAVSGDLGTSIRAGQPVTTLIAGRLPVTLSLALLAIIVTMIIGVGLGLLSVLNDGWIGRAAQVVAVVGASIPNFWLAILLVLVFSIQLRLFPATGYVPISGGLAWLQSLALPVIAIALAGVAATARQTRAALGEALGRDSIRTLLAAGTPRRTIIAKHAMRNAATPVVTSLSFQFILLLGGAIVVEQVFALPGIGQLMINSINSHDIPVIQGVVLATAVLVLVVNLAVDLINAWLNPKVRFA